MALEEAAVLGVEPLALALFIFEVAFPSAEWDSTWLCLDMMMVSQWLSRGLRFTYDDAQMPVLNGEVFDDIVVVVRRGIE